MVGGYGFPAPIIEAAADWDSQLRLMPFGGAILLRVSGVLDVTTQSYAPITILCREGLILTLHARPLALKRELVEVGPLISLIAPPSSEAVLAAMLLMLSYRSATVGLALRSKLAALSRRIDEGSAEVDLSEILRAKFAVADLEGGSEGQLQLLELLVEVRRNAPEVRTLLQIARANAEYVERFITQLERRVRDIRTEFDSHIAERTNRRLNVLSVVSALFLPPTLLVGIFGMNFDNMPVLHQPLGYWSTLIIMVTFASASLLLFWRRGWFR